LKKEREKKERRAYHSEGNESQNETPKGKETLFAENQGKETPHLC